MTRPVERNATEAEAEAAIRILKGAIEAAENANQAGENAVVRAAAAICGEARAKAHLIAAAPDMYEALTLHQAWADSENAGPDYGSLTRDTHPDGERIWRQWWEANLDLCSRAESATKAALLKARGEQP